MISEQAVREALHTVKDPEINKPIDDIGMLKSFDIAGEVVRVNVLLTVAGCPLKAEITNRVTQAVMAVPGVKKVDVDLGVMSEDQRAELAGGLKRDIPFNRSDSRTTVIGVSSGKGGVGKSTVTTNLAAALASLGHRVGVLDADIWGFSIPRMFGLRGQRPVAFNQMIMPLDQGGVKVISIGFFLEREEDPVVWRGPMLHKALEQFLGDVYWGEDLEYLLIDLPPGTGDISISLASFLPGMGMLVVTTPQPVAQKVAERAANMSGKVNLRVLGVVENMTGGVFGDGGGKLLADTLGVPLLAQIPLLGELRESSDEGRPFVWDLPGHPVSETYVRLAKELANFRPKRRLPVMQSGTQAHQHSH
jgi:ATP-binding protein involved in chromosome partitioning